MLPVLFLSYNKPVTFPVDELGVPAVDDPKFITWPRNKA